MLSVIGIVCWLWLLLTPAAILLGLIAQRQYRRHGQRDTLAKVTWIGGILMLVLYIVLIVLHSPSAHTSGR